MKIIENNYITRTNFRLIQQSKPLTTIEPEQLRAVEDYSPIFYNYFPNINFEGSAIRRPVLTQAGLEQLLRGRDIVEKLTELASGYGKDYATFKTELIQKLSQSLPTAGVRVARLDVPRLCDLVYNNLHPRIAGILCELGLDNTSKVMKFFDTSNFTDDAKWDVEKVGLFIAYGLSFKRDSARFDELKANANQARSEGKAPEEIFGEGLFPWAIKWGVSDKNIQDFLEARKEGYDILDEELLYCIVNKLTSKDKIERYVELRKREYNYLHEHTVRGQGGELHYPVRLAMMYTMNGLTDAKIAELEQKNSPISRYELYNNAPWVFPSSFMKSESYKSRVEYLSFLELLDKGWQTTMPMQKVTEASRGEPVRIIRKNRKERFILPNLDKWECTRPLLQPFKDINDLYCQQSLELEHFNTLPFKEVFPLPKFKDFPKSFYCSQNFEIEDSTSQSSKSGSPLSKFKDYSNAFHRKAGQPFSYFTFDKGEINLLNSLSYLRIMPEIKEYLPMDVWYQAHTNTDAKTFKVLQKALARFSGIKKGDRVATADFDVKNITRNISRLDNPTVMYSSNELKYDSNTSILKFVDNNNGFEVELFPVIIEDEKALLFLNDDRGYLAYKGAIFEIKNANPVNETTRLSLGKYANIYRAKQIPVLMDAVRFFPVNILKGNGTSLIGQGLRDVSKYKGAEHNTNDTKAHYGGLFSTLRGQGDLTVKNILKIMPTDANISINPCITDGRNIMYSISSEWSDSDGVKWQLRVHSTDLGYSHGGNKWIARCAYKVSDNDKPEYLYEDNGAISGVFDKEAEPGVAGGVSIVQSHIKIDSPIEDEDSLLNNVYFQNIAHQISLNVEKVDFLKRLASSMGILFTNDVKRDIDNIMQKLQQDPLLYAYNKDDVDKLRKYYGYLTCS